MPKWPPITVPKWPPMPLRTIIRGRRAPALPLTQPTPARRFRVDRAGRLVPPCPPPQVLDRCRAVPGEPAVGEASLSFRGCRPERVRWATTMRSMPTDAGSWSKAPVGVLRTSRPSALLRVSKDVVTGCARSDGARAGMRVVSAGSSFASWAPVAVPRFASDDRHGPQGQPANGRRRRGYRCSPSSACRARSGRRLISSELEQGWRPTCGATTLSLYEEPVDHPDGDFAAATLDLGIRASAALFVDHSLGGLLAAHVAAHSIDDYQHDDKLWVVVPHLEAVEAVGNAVQA